MTEHTKSIHAIDWQQVRNLDGSIDLCDAYKRATGINTGHREYEFLVDVEKLHPIHSRQAAAVAIAWAWHMSPED